MRKEALALAQELLRLNKIRVEVGTLPPIDITQAEAGVASTEEAVIVAQANIADAEDRLRRVMGMDPKSEEWQRSIEPTDDYSITTRDVDLDSEIKTAIANRTDLESARLQLKNDDTTLAYQRNQLKYTLNGRASLQYQGLSGDTPAFPVFDANGMFLGNVPPVNSGFTDPLMDVKDAKFPTWSVQATLGIPIGNRAAEAQYVRARLQKEQQSIQYDNLEQAAIVAVAGAVRTVGTDLKRIDAAERNRVLQEKTVEAEQKKFENGLSTSFQVLQFQRDLAEARSAENAAKRDYQTSLANLDAATGVLEKKFDIKIEDYSRE